MKLVMNILSSEDPHECTHHSQISPGTTTVITSLNHEDSCVWVKDISYVIAYVG
jgi:hypothetical protein